MNSRSIFNPAPRTGLHRRLMRFLFSWRTARRLFLGAAILITVLAAVYLAENWRGRRAWAECRGQLQAQGEILDWTAHIPPPVPDDHNILKAPNMAEWFVKPNATNRYTNELTEKLNTGALGEESKRNTNREPLLLALITFLPAQGVLQSNAPTALRLNTPHDRRQFAMIIQDIVGPSASSFQGFGSFVRQPLRQIQPRQIVLQTELPPELETILSAIPTNLIPSDVGRLQVEPGPNSNEFRVQLFPQATVSAEAYLDWSDRVAPEFDLIRAALQRPYIRFDDDYQRPYEIPILNFVTARGVAQTAAQRAKCCLLLGRSEQAFRELALVLQLRQLFQSRPTTLVAAMIDVAIGGLCADTIADGLRLNAWRPPELMALQNDLQTIDFASGLVDAFRCERIAFIHTLERSSGPEMARIFFRGSSQDTLWARMTDPNYLLLNIGPRGWLYQQLVAITSLQQSVIEAFDTTLQFIQPARLDAIHREAERTFSHWSPYTYLAAMATPNFSRAIQTTVRNQTKINQALIVCGLERYRQTYQRYPTNLDALIPDFVAKMPLDIIGGQPLKFRLIPEDHFVLYSVGWNEKDDGGANPPTSPPGQHMDFTQGDWVWPASNY
ncbi:MAG TPA: hypothetical protein P5186_06970 [Candidatus Paceibacterota bacterium]|nr:hypothetical protein [Candidatus Paceibacterota bacterium]HRZ99742.1 hypothetical protein [Candidatus Paceibacterota bacterium]